MVNAPFGRIGGKSRIAKKLISLFPKSYKTFVDLFVGAGSVFYNSPKVEKEVINDLDTDVYKVHKLLKTKSQWVNNNIERKITENYFDSRKKKKDALSTLEKFRSSFFSFGLSKNPQRIGTTISTDFSKYGERLKDTIILNTDFRKVINLYDSKDTFFYLDPPYSETLGTRYYKHHNILKPQEIYDSLENIKGKFMLSYNDTKENRDLFKKYNIKTITTKYIIPTKGTDNKKTVKELIITNY